jgi:hypothetical protein
MFNDDIIFDNLKVYLLASYRRSESYVLSDDIFFHLLIILGLYYKSVVLFILYSSN